MQLGRWISPKDVETAKITTFGRLRIGARFVFVDSYNGPIKGQTMGIKVGRREWHYDGQPNYIRQVRRTNLPVYVLKEAEA